jgi:hypothetical protein
MLTGPREEEEATQATRKAKSQVEADFYRYMSDVLFP